MAERHSFFTVTRVGLILWATTMMFFVLIPRRYWHYPDDLWLRIIVMAPAMIAVGLFLFDNAKQLGRHPDQIRRRRNLFQDAEVVIAMFVIAGIVYWKWRG